MLLHILIVMLLPTLIGILLPILTWVSLLPILMGILLLILTLVSLLKCIVLDVKRDVTVLAEFFPIRPYLIRSREIGCIKPVNNSRVSFLQHYISLCLYVYFMHNACANRCGDIKRGTYTYLHKDTVDRDDKYTLIDINQRNNCRYNHYLKSAHIPRYTCRHVCTFVCVHMYVCRYTCACRHVHEDRWMD